MKMESALLRCVAVALACFAVAPFAARAQEAPADAASGAASGPASRVLLTAPSNVAYTVSPGDVIDVNFRWTPEFNETVTVQPDGHVALLSIGDLNVSGMTLRQFHDAVVARASEKLVDPEVTVTPKDFDRPHFVVAGEVATPGRYDLRTATTALQAVLLAGGEKQTGDLSNVILFRRLNTEYSEVHRLKLGKADKNGRDKGDMLLQPGDMLLVSRTKLESIGRYVKTLNLGVYFSPFTGVIP